MVKLFYTNIYGQIVNPDTSMWVSSKSTYIGYEEYESMEKATEVAEAFVSKYPLLSCLLCLNKDTEEIVISARK